MGQRLCAVWACLLLKITAGLLQICWLNSTHEVGTGLTATWYKFTKYVHSFTYSLQVTIKTNLLAELKHQAPNSISNSSDRELRITRYLLRSTYLPATTDHFASTTVTGGWIVTTVPLWSYHWAFDSWRIYCDGSSTFSVCVSSELLRDGREGRTPMAWHFPVW